MQKRIGWMGLLVFMWVLLIACSVTGDISDVRDVGKSFMTALRDGEHVVSYDLLSPEVQQEIGGMEQWVAFATPRAFSDWSFSSTNIENDAGQMDGEATLNGDEYNVTLVFGKYGENWKITGINFILK